MGHARTYLGFDIIRRILTGHFGYDVTLVMNITDLDDKIIERANEQSIPCTELSRRFEAEFHEDMQNLHVAPPDVLTRVTEYMDEIVRYIQTIVDKKLAYASNGSVYFDVAAFDASSEEMNYCKLEPEQINNAKLLAEGEGKLTQDFVGDKRSPRDFALWKRSKEGEPTWDSPWGKGRPGWHIECSVMASEIFAQIAGLDSAEEVVHGSANHDKCKMDIHSGGVDLKFPHHDNEMAQAEAHSGCNQWVNYFVHAGHLHIKGFKMSKSLKNFITIRQALETHTARQIRLCFLLHKYNAPMDYGDNTMSHALTMEKTFTEFFHNVKAILRNAGNLTSGPQRWNPHAKQLHLAVNTAQRNVDNALKDDFDTPTCMSALIDLVKASNLYMETTTTEYPIVTLVVRNAALYITRIFKMFGLIPESAGVDIGFPMSQNSASASANDDILSPILDALLTFRSSVRNGARNKDISQIMAQCDSFRDDVLPPLGIRLEDKDPPVWKLADPAELMKEREQKLLEKKRKEEEKAKAAAEKAKKDALNKLTPEDFMRQLTIDDTVLKYSKFDDSTGLPTHFHDGEPLNKNQLKKANKEFQGQKKKYEKYIGTQ